MSKTIKPPKGSDSLSAWGTTASASYSSKAKNLTTGLVQPFSQSRVFISKAKPQSGKAKLRDGWRNPTVFRAYSCKLTPGQSFKYQFRSGAFTWKHEGERGYNPAFPGMDIYLGTSGSGRFPRTSENLVNRAEVECMNKLKDSDMNLGESIATINQTLGTIADAAISLRNLLAVARGKILASRKSWQNMANSRQDFNSRRKRAGLKPMRHAEFMKSKGYPVKKPKPFSLADTWLQYIYAWTPLLNDIQSLIKMAKRGIPGVPVKAIRNLTEEHALPAPPWHHTGSPYRFHCSGMVRSGVKVRIDALVTNPALAQLDALGLINPFALAWELIPFSFVIDWLVPIGNSLKALSARVGMRLRGISTTRYTTAAVTMNWYQWEPIDLGSPIRCSVNSLSTWRTTSSSWPWAGLYWKSPFTSASRAATALALLSKMR